MDLDAEEVDLRGGMLKTDEADENIVACKGARNNRGDAGLISLRAEGKPGWTRKPNTNILDPIGQAEP